MSATGIGAAVRRKEDFRFITGKGQYTDDVKRPGQTHIHFIRSPHAHAKIKKIDTSAATGMPGVVAVLTGKELADDKIGDLICGWAITSKDGTPMKMAAHPAIAADKANHVGDAVAVVIAETLDAGQGRGRKSQGRLRGAAGCCRSRQGAGEGRAADPRGRAEQHDLQLAPRRRRRDGGRVQGRQARHQARHHQQPAGAERDGAARGDRRLRSRQRQLHALEYDAEPACRAARDLGVHRHGAGAQAARDRAGCRRRFRLEDFHLSGRSRVPVGIAEGQPSGEMDCRTARRASSPTRMAAITSPCRAGARRDGKITALRAQTIANLGAYMSTFSSSVPTYLYATLLSGQYGIANIYCEVDAVYTNTVPVDAYRGAGRPEATYVVERLIEVAARELSIDPADLRKRNFVKHSRTRRRCMAYDAGDYDASLKKALEIHDYKGFGKRKRDSARNGKLRGLGFSTYIEACGIAPSRRSASSAPASGCGSPPKCASTRPARSKFSPARTATGRATRRPSRSLSRSGSAFRSRTSRSSTATPTRCSSAWVLTARAPARSACRRSSRRSTRSRPRPRRSQRFMLEAAEGDIEFKDGKFTVAGTDKSAAFGDVALQAYVAHKFTGARDRAGPEGRRVLRPDQLHVPGGLPHLRTRNRSPRPARPRSCVDRGRRLRHHHQSDDRRRAGARRHRAGRRTGALRTHGL